MTSAYNLSYKPCHCIFNGAEFWTLTGSLEHLHYFLCSHSVVDLLGLLWEIILCHDPVSAKLWPSSRWPHIGYLVYSSTTMLDSWSWVGLFLFLFIKHDAIHSGKHPTWDFSVHRTLLKKSFFCQIQFFQTKVSYLYLFLFHPESLPNNK